MKAYNFPKAMQNKDNCNFSLSGLKTAKLDIPDKLDKPLTNKKKQILLLHFNMKI